MNVQQNNPTQNSYVDDYQNPGMPGNNPAPMTNAAPQPIGDAGDSESLEDQNVFALLGVSDGTEEEKEAFLDELQQVIWEDFLENDLELLVTQDEKQKVQTILADAAKDEMQKQEEVLTYLEGLIPDLEEIMLEKALELKEDMVGERIAGLKEFFAGQEDKLTKLNEAAVLIKQENWLSASKLLNSLT